MGFELLPLQGALAAVTEPRVHVPQFLASQADKMKAVFIITLTTDLGLFLVNLSPIATFRIVFTSNIQKRLKVDRQMKTLGNIIWVVFGGLHIALEYFIAGLVLMITIIGIPFGLQSLKLGMLAIWPFGTEVKWKESQPGCLSIFMNVLWFFVGGIWIWLTHIFYGLVFCITIIGIPFGKMHFRLAKLALSPFGKEIS